MVANYLIGLREGLEAAIVVSILITYLVRTNRTHLISKVWFGVGLAAIVSILEAIALESISADLSEHWEPIFTGAVSLLAVAFVTWMIFWMQRSAHTISGDLRHRVDDAVALGSGMSIVVLAFFAVFREGAETAMFFWSAAHATGSVQASIAGLALGLASASVVGWLFFTSTRKVNISKFFFVTGIALVFVAAGVLSYAVAEFQEVGVLPGAENIALDLSGLLPEGSVLSAIIGGLFNIHAQTNWLQVVAYVAYVTVVLFIILRNRNQAVTKSSETSAVVDAPNDSVQV